MKQLYIAQTLMPTPCLRFLEDEFNLSNPEDAYPEMMRWFIDSHTAPQIGSKVAFIIQGEGAPLNYVVQVRRVISLLERENARSSWFAIPMTPGVPQHVVGLGSVYCTIPYKKLLDRLDRCEFYSGGKERVIIEPGWLDDVADEDQLDGVMMDIAKAAAAQARSKLIDAISWQIREAPTGDIL